MARCSRWPFRGRRPLEGEEEEGAGAEEEEEEGARSEEEAGEVARSEEEAGAGEGARGWASEAAAGEEVEESTSISSSPAAALRRRLRQRRRREQLLRPPRSSLASWLLLLRLLPSRTRTSERCCWEGRNRETRRERRENMQKSQRFEKVRPQPRKHQNADSLLPPHSRVTAFSFFLHPVSEP